jgi:hypothetical protein
MNIDEIISKIKECNHEIVSVPIEFGFDYIKYKRVCKYCGMEEKYLKNKNE